jgi:hypothetical protein
LYFWNIFSWKYDRIFGEFFIYCVLFRTPKKHDVNNGRPFNKKHPTRFLYLMWTIPLNFILMLIKLLQFFSNFSAIFQHKKTVVKTKQPFKKNSLRTAHYQRGEILKNYNSLKLKKAVQNLLKVVQEFLKKLSKKCSNLLKFKNVH